MSDLAKDFGSDAYTVWRKAGFEGPNLSEVFGDVEGVKIISAAVPYMATVQINEEAMKQVEDIAAKENLMMTPARGVELL